uniref:RNA-directed DNA polymerase n=1 Tax=Caenorhabditis japonica TaxID=281687 RepID=A0A8R1IUB2_CAEJA
MHAPLPPPLNPTLGNLLTSVTNTMIFQKIDQQQQNTERDLRHKRRTAQLEANRIGRQLAEVEEQYRREQLARWEPGNDVLPAVEQENRPLNEELNRNEEVQRQARMVDEPLQPNLRASRPSLRDAPRYDGMGSFATYVRNLNDFLTAYQHTEEDAKRMMPLLLTGSARDALDRIPKDVREGDWRQLVTRLMEEVHPRDRQLVAQTEMNGLRQQSLSAEVFLRKVREIADVAWPGESNRTVREAIVLANFVNGLKDEVRVQVHRSAVKNVEEALCVAKREESLMRIGGGDALVEAINHLKIATNELLLQKAEVNYIRTAQPPPQSRQKNIKCFNCGKPGHYKRDCRSSKPERCHECGGHGHLAEECATARKQRRRHAEHINATFEPEAIRARGGTTLGGIVRNMALIATLFALILPAEAWTTIRAIDLVDCSVPNGVALINPPNKVDCENVAANNLGNGKLVSSLSNSVRNCTLDDEFCQSSSSTIVWRKTANRPRCDFITVGNFSASIGDKMLILDKQESAFPLDEKFSPKEVEECFPGEVYSSRGLTFFTFQEAKEAETVKSTILTSTAKPTTKRPETAEGLRQPPPHPPTRKKRSSRNGTEAEEQPGTDSVGSLAQVGYMKASYDTAEGNRMNFTAEMVNNKLTYLAKKIEERDKDNFNQLINSICHVRNRQMGVWRMMLQFDPTAAMRILLNRNDVTAMFKGKDVVQVTQCSKVTVTQIEQNRKSGSACTTRTAAKTTDNRIVYLEPGQTEVFHNTGVMECDEVSNYVWQDHDGSFKEADKILNKEVTFLGLLVGREGVKPNPEKVRAIAEFPVPKSVTGVRGFLGMANYFRKFVRGFAEMAAPLNDLTKKDVAFSWTSKHQTSFDEIKMALCRAPVLAAAVSGKPFVMETDASSIAVGAMLLQEGDDKELHPIAFASRKLTVTERKYVAIEAEALGLAFGVKAFRTYILGSKITAIVDHRPLTSLLHRRDLIGRLAKYQIVLQELSLEIVYRPGRLNSVCDALSRYIGNEKKEARGSSEKEDVVNTVSGGHITVEEMKEIQSTSDFIMGLAEKLQDGNQNLSMQYFIKKGLVYKKCNNGKDAILLPNDKEVIEKITKFYHETAHLEHGTIHSELH